MRVGVLVGILAGCGLVWLIADHFDGPRCTPGRPQWARHGACMKFCQADGRGVYPLCMIPHPLQHPDAERRAAPPEPERNP